MKKLKIILGIVAVVLVLGVAAVSIWWMLRPQVITFSDDSKVTLLGVDYGKHHVSPTSSATAETAATATTANRPVRRGGPFTTTNDTLVIWVRQEYDAQQFHNFQYFIYDPAGVACAQNLAVGYINGSRQQSNEVVGIQFPAFPRREGKLVVRAMESGSDGQEMSDNKFVIANPARGPFPAWTSELPPITREDGNLSVTLTKLVCGADAGITRDSNNPDDAVNKGVLAAFNVSQDGKPVTDWRPISIETSDATGNHVVGVVFNTRWQDNAVEATCQYGLWPDEPAWKLRVQFAKQSGYTDDEMMKVQNIPVEPGRRQDFRVVRRVTAGVTNTIPVAGVTNTVFAEGDLNGYHVKVFRAKQFTDVPANSQPSGGIQVQFSPPLPPMTMGTMGMMGARPVLQTITDDQGQDVRRYGYSSSSNGKSTTFNYTLGDMAGVKSLNLTIVLAKNRFVEFTAKPEKQ
jgi:hypothetical protein